MMPNCVLPRHGSMVVLSAHGPVGLFLRVKSSALHFSLLQHQGARQGDHQVAMISTLSI